jgi:hypothetical protein
MRDLDDFKKSHVFLGWLKKRYGSRFADQIAATALDEEERLAALAATEKERLAAKAKAARPNFQVIAADSARAEMLRSFIHDGHDPRRAHSLGT